MRVLCIHGAGSNAEIFKKQCQPFFHEIALIAGNGGYVFDFYQGTVPDFAHPSLEEQSSEEKHFFTHFKPSSKQSVLAAEEHLLQFITNNGPYDGVLAFSFGAALATIAMMLHHQRQLLRGLTPVPLFKFAAFVCGASAPYKLENGRLVPSHHSAKDTTLHIEEPFFIEVIDCLHNESKSSLFSPIEGPPHSSHSTAGSSGSFLETRSSVSSLVLENSFAKFGSNISFKAKNAVEISQNLVDDIQTPPDSLSASTLSDRSRPVFRPRKSTHPSSSEQVALCAQQVGYIDCDGLTLFKEAPNTVGTPKEISNITEVALAHTNSRNLSCCPTLHVLGGAADSLLWKSKALLQACKASEEESGHFRTRSITTYEGHGMPSEEYTARAMAVHFQEIAEEALATERFWYKS